METKTLAWVREALQLPTESQLLAKPLHGGVSARMYAIFQTKADLIVAAASHVTHAGPVRAKHAGPVCATDATYASHATHVHEAQPLAVLRQIDNADWLREQPDVLLQEAASLQCMQQQQRVAAPRLIAIDERGTSCDHPSLLMSALPGHVVVSPEHLEPWLQGLAQALVQIHIHSVQLSDAACLSASTSGSQTTDRPSSPSADHMTETPLDRTAGTTAVPYAFAPYSNVSQLDTSAWSCDPDAWQRAVQYLLLHKPSYKPYFIHRDFHPANVLWKDGRVSGVVDWVNGCMGPLGMDVGHCRTNLIQLFGIPAAERFLRYYVMFAQPHYTFTYDPYWDLTSLLDFVDGSHPEVYRGWIDLGVKGLTDQLITERIEHYLQHLLARLPKLN